MSMTVFTALSLGLAVDILVVIIYEYGMEELEMRVFNKNPITDDQMLKWTAQIAKGLQKLHENHFIHRNLNQQMFS